MRLLIALCILVASVCAEDVPDWVIRGIAAVETSSHYRNGFLVYVDRRDGLAGEVGPFQMTRAAYDTIKQPGDSFSRMRHDAKYAERMARRYLVWLRQGGKRSWEEVVGRYNGGRRVIVSYAERVKAVGTAAL